MLVSAGCFLLQIAPSKIVEINSFWILVAKSYKRVWVCNIRYAYDRIYQSSCPIKYAWPEWLEKFHLVKNEKSTFVNKKQNINVITYACLFQYYALDVAEHKYIIISCSWLILDFVVAVVVVVIVVFLWLVSCSHFRRCSFS